MAAEEPSSLLAMTRRRFLHLVGLAAAGAAVAAAVPHVAAASAPKEDTTPAEEARPTVNREEVPWERRRAMMLRAHEDTVAYSKEE